MRSLLLLGYCWCALGHTLRARPIDFALEVSPSPPPRVAWAADQLERGLSALGHHVTRDAGASDALRIVIGAADAAHVELLAAPPSEAPAEGFRLHSAGNGVLVVAGADASGAMYGCLEVLDLAASGALLNAKQFAAISRASAPALTVRGFAMPLPCSPLAAPWFSDHEFWTRWLDDLAHRRFNVVSLWWQALPEAAELGETYRWLSVEADRRGIAVAVVAPLPPATTGARLEQLAGSAPGAMLGLRGSLAQLRDVVVPALKNTGRQPPLLWCDAEPKAAAALAAVYEPLVALGNLSGDVLASPHYIDPAVRTAGDSVAQAAIVRTGNLRPFRWFAPGFIQSCVRALVAAQVRGVHVFPTDAELFPLTADKTTPRTTQLDRDWLWREGWGRYAWSPEREAGEDASHWERQLTSYFGTSRKTARLLLDAMEAEGQILPRIASSFAVGTDQTVDIALGGTLEQLMDRTQRWFNDRPGVSFDEELAISQRGESVPAGKDHMLAAAGEILNAASKASETLPKVARHVTHNVPEFERWSADIDCVAKLANFYADKMRAAYHARLYRIDRDPSRFPHLEGFLSRSCDYFKTLASLHAYYYEPFTAPARCVPFPASHALTFKDVLLAYQRELAVVKANVALLKAPPGDPYLRELAAQMIHAAADSLLVDVPDRDGAGPWLLVELAPHACEAGAAGGTAATIELDDDGQVTRLLDVALRDPWWRPCCISLRRFAGKSVTLRLVAAPAAGGEPGAVVFGNPRIVSGQLPVQVAPAVLPAGVRVELALAAELPRARWDAAAGCAAAGDFGGPDQRPGVLLAPARARRTPFAVALEVRLPASASAASGGAR
ncbi:MAG: hypothetical protein U1E76_04220 [Planctomycetota bacterium]